MSAEVKGEMRQAIFTKTVYGTIHFLKLYAKFAVYMQCIF